MSRLSLVSLLLAFACPSLLFAQELPRTPFLDRQARFWEKIFTEYDKESFVLHDRDNPDIVITVLRALDQPGKRASTAMPKPPEKSIEVYRQSLALFVEKGADLRFAGTVEQTIWEAYRDHHALQALLKGEARLRVQGGLADTFREASHRAALYLPQMERIFRQNKLPVTLTRIPFVESMFHLKARSKVGASGFWQLMPATAKDYIAVNREKDERNSPLIATKAAAAVLQNNYTALQDWPLAVTAYNHGLGGMKKAMRELKTNSLTEIIQRYQAPSFGFASRNFYAELLAAIQVHEKLSGELAIKPSTQDRSRF